MHTWGHPIGAAQKGSPAVTKVTAVTAVAQKKGKKATPDFMILMTWREPTEMESLKIGLNAYAK